MKVGATGTRSRRKALAALLAGLSMYVLSFGPIVGFFVAHNQPPPELLVWFYRPVHWCMEQTPLGFPIMLYLYFWERLYRGH